MWNFRETATLWFAATTVIFSACGQEAKTTPKVNPLFIDLHIEKSIWNLGDRTKRAEPYVDPSVQMHPRDVRDIYVKNMTYKYFREEKDSKKRHLMAAILYLDRAQNYTRGIVAECDGLGVDISPFRDRFNSQHESENAAIDIILAQQNITRDTVWNRNKMEVMLNANVTLWDMDGLGDTSIICAKIKASPNTYAQPFNLADEMPIVAAQLQQVLKQDAKTHQPEITAIPPLRQ